MKIRLAKKIMNQRPPACGGSDARQHTMYYWHWRWLEWYNTTHSTISYKPCGLVLDHRITKAKNLVERWFERKCTKKAIKCTNKAITYSKKHPFKPISIQCSYNKLVRYFV